MTKVIEDLNFLGKFAARAVLLDPVSSNPAGLGAGDAGRVWYNTTTNKWMYWNGSAAIDPVARANHSGTQTWSTISDGPASVQAYRLDQFANATSPLTAPDGTLSTHLATKGQLDAAIAALTSGQVLKGAVVAAATSNVNIASPGTTIDGITASNGDIFLLTNQTTGSQNGPYVFNGSGAAMTRATNWDTSGEAVLGSYWIVEQGSKADTFALLTNDSAITLGTTTPAFAFMSGVTISGSGVISVVGGVVSLSIGTGLLNSGGNLVPDYNYVAKAGVSGVIPTSTSAPVTVSGSTVTINHALNNWGAFLVLTAYTSPASGFSQGDRILQPGTPTDANNIQVVLPAAPASNNWHYRVF